MNGTGASERMGTVAVITGETLRATGGMAAGIR